ncbi:MAG: hypothetical protein WA771_07500 [Chthoniobacterales bacterium]
MSYEMSFEERHTAWVDGTMEESEREAFERELPNAAEAERERAGWQALRSRLREAVPTASLPHEDFVNSQVLEAIRQDERRTGEETKGREESRGLFPLWRMAWGGGALVAIAAVLSGIWIFGNSGGPGNDQLISRVIAAEAQDPAAEAYVFQAPSGRGTVLWIEGAGYIPPTERL